MNMMKSLNKIKIKFSNKSTRPNLVGTFHEFQHDYVGKSDNWRFLVNESFLVPFEIFVILSYI